MAHDNPGHRTAVESEIPRERPPAGRIPDAHAPSITALLNLQSAAGNSAVSTLVSRLPVARQAATRPPAAPLPPVPAAAPAATAVPAPVAAPGPAGPAGPTSPAPGLLLSAAPPPPGGAGLLAPTPSPLDAVATLHTAAERMPTLLAGAATAATGAVPHGPAPTGLAGTTTGPEPAGPESTEAPVDAGPIPSDAPSPAGAVPGPGADADPAQVAGITNATVQQVGTAATGAEAAMAGDFGASALAPTAPPVVLPRTAVPADATGLPTPPVAPDLEPAVARELTSARGGELQTALTAASQKAETASTAHGAELAAQVAASNTTITAEREGTAAAQVQERATTSTELAAHRTAVQSRNAAATAEFSATAATLASGANADISSKLTEARTAADTELAAAGGGADAPAQRSTAPVVVSRSWWGDVKDAVGRGVSAVGSAVSSVRDRVSGLLDRAMSFVRDRVRRFATAVATAARETAARVAAAARQAGTWMRDRVRAGLTRINALAGRLATAVGNLVSRLRARITGLVADLRAKLVRAYEAAAAVVKKVLAAAETVRMFLRLMANNVLSGLLEIVRDPMAVIMKAKGVIGGLVAGVPAKLEGVLAEHVAPLLGPSSGSVASDVTGAQRAPAAAGPSVQRQVAATAEPEVEGETHWGGVKEHLAERGRYMWDNFWEVVKDGLFEALVPGVAVYRHLPVVWDEIVASWNAFKAGESSAGWDHILTIGRELMAVVASVVAQASLVVFIIVSVFGTPVAGEAALVGIGAAVIAADAALQIATILKSASNLSERSPVPVPQPENETDYGRIADASIAVAFMLALLAIGAAASASAKALLRKFPAIGAAVEAARARLRRTAAPKPVEPPGTKPKIATPEPIEEKPRTRVDEEGLEEGKKGGPAEETIPEGITNDDVHIEDLNEPGRVPGEPDLDVGLCFPAGTLVAAPGGPRAIEDVAAGQLVYALDFATDRVVTRRVLGLTRGTTTRWIAIRLATETIRATPGHPFWEESAGAWTKAEELAPGMALRLRDGGVVAVVAVAEVGLDEPETTYNFSVAEVENYFAGASGVLVHNITETRKAYLRRFGYRNYVLTAKDGTIYYSGMCRQGETAAGLMRRHGANGNRFNFANGDRVVFEAGIREYFEARLMEVRTALKNGLVIGRNSPLGQRGNISRPLDQAKEAEYLQAERLKSNCG